MTAAPPVYVRQPKTCWSCDVPEGSYHSKTCERRLKQVLLDEPSNKPSMDNPAAYQPRLATDSDKRKEVPVVSGCLDYFPDALAAIAELSYVGNQKHNPGEPLHWARGKSTDEADCLVRHLLERGTVDTDGIRHSVKVAWRALALLQKELEEATGLPISRGSKP